MTTQNLRRTAGRPRSSEADRVILQTALRLLMDQGYDAMSMEGVAAAAGVGKTTIYRRYPTKRELVVAAVLSLTAMVRPPADSGDVREDLFVLMSQIHAIMRSSNVFAILGTLLVKEREDPELLDLFRRLVIGPRMELVATVLRRGVKRGQLRADMPIDVAVQTLGGAIFARHIAGQPEDESWLRSLIDLVLAGMSVR